MHLQVIINPGVTSPAANGSRVYFQADSLITVNFSWIFFPQAHETSASQRGGCLCLPKQLVAEGTWGRPEGTGGQATCPFLLPYPQKVLCEADGPVFAHHLPTHTLGCRGGHCHGGSGLGEAGRGEREGAQWDPAGFCPEGTLGWLGLPS